MKKRQREEKKEKSPAEQEYEKCMIEMYKSKLETDINNVLEEERITGVLLMSKVKNWLDKTPLESLKVFSEGEYETMKAKITELVMRAEKNEKQALDQYFKEYSEKTAVDHNTSMFYYPYRILLTEGSMIFQNNSTSLQRIEEYAHSHLLFGYKPYMTDLLSKPQLQENIAETIRQQGAYIKNLTDLQQGTLEGYCLNDFPKIWNACETLTPDKYDSDVKTFFSVFEMCDHSLPEGFILFEGQGKYEMEFVTKPPFAGEVRTRKRPTSTSIWMHSAATFVGSSPTVDPPFSLKNENSTAKYFRKYHDGGCILVHKLKSPNIRGLFRFLMNRSILEEGEVILEPNLTITILSIEKQAFIPKMNPVNPARQLEPLFIDTIFTEITK